MGARHSSAKGVALVSIDQTGPGPKGVAMGPSTPHIAFVPFQIVLSQDSPKLVLEGFLLVVRYLLFDVSTHSGHITCAHGEGPIAGLPREQGKITTLSL